MIILEHMRNQSVRKAGWPWHLDYWHPWSNRCTGCRRRGSSITEVCGKECLS